MPAGTSSSKASKPAPTPNWAVLGQMALELNSGEPLERTFSQCLDLLAGNFQADTAAILLFDQDSESLQPVALHGLDDVDLPPFIFPSGRPLSGWDDHDTLDLLEHAPALSGSVPTQQRLNGPVLDSSQAAIYPIGFREEAHGLLCLFLNPKAPGLSEEATDLLVAASSSLGTSLSAGALREDVMSRERMERELQFAHTLQRCFSPRNLPVHPNYQLGAKRTHSLEMNGDFYDALQQGEQLVIAAGTTAGQGLDAGIHIAHTVFELRGALAAGHGPARTLELLNHTLAEQGRRGFLVHLALVFLDPSSGILTFAGAGNTQLCLFDRTNGKVSHLDHGSPTPMGMLAQWTFREHQTVLPADGSLVLYTEGLHDSTAEMEDIALPGHIEEGLRSGCNGPLPTAQELFDALQERMGTFASHLDCTVLSIDRRD